MVTKVSPESKESVKGQKGQLMIREVSPRPKGSVRGQQSQSKDSTKLRVLFD